MNKTKHIVVFIALNFLALLIGGLFTNSGVTGEWYADLNKAPITPPGWVFGLAWTVIMICYSIYMGILSTSHQDSYGLYFIYALQWVLNVSWNPIFFYYHKLFFGLFIIAALLFVLVLQIFTFIRKSKSLSFLVLPYVLWLMLAFYLNTFAFFEN